MNMLRLFYSNQESTVSSTQNRSKIDYAIKNSHDKELTNDVQYFIEKVRWFSDNSSL